MAIHILTRQIKTVSSLLYPFEAKITASCQPSLFSLSVCLSRWSFISPPHYVPFSLRLPFLSVLHPLSLSSSIPLSHVILFLSLVLLLLSIFLYLPSLFTRCGGHIGKYIDIAFCSKYHKHSPNVFFVSEVCSQLYPHNIYFTHACTYLTVFTNNHQHPMYVGQSGNAGQYRYLMLPPYWWVSVKRDKDFIPAAQELRLFALYLTYILLYGKR